MRLCIVMAQNTSTKEERRSHGSATNSYLCAPVEITCCRVTFFFLLSFSEHYCYKAFLLRCIKQRRNHNKRSTHKRTKSGLLLAFRPCGDAPFFQLPTRGPCHGLGLFKPICTTHKFPPQCIRAVHSTGSSASRIRSRSCAPPPPRPLSGTGSVF